MIYEKTVPYTAISLAWSNSFDRYKTTIYSKIDSWWKEEDLFEKACSQFKVGAYFLAQLYTTLIITEIQNGYIKSWSEIETKYDLVNMRKNFACRDINIDYIFLDFGIDITLYGINNMDIEQYNIVEPSEDLPVNTSSMNLIQYINSQVECTSSIETC